MQFVVGSLKVVVIGKGKCFSRSAGVRRRLVCMRGEGGLLSVAGVRWDGEIWGVVGDAMWCRIVAWDRGGESIAVRCSGLEKD